jgi:hypothetical protein
MVPSSEAVANLSSYFEEKDTAMTLPVWLSATAMYFMVCTFTRNIDPFLVPAISWKATHIRIDSGEIRVYCMYNYLKRVDWLRERDNRTIQSGFGKHLVISREALESAIPPSHD